MRSNPRVEIDALARLTRKRYLFLPSTFIGGDY